MPAELSQFMELALGRRPNLQVGDLPRPVAQYFNCHPAIVFLGKSELEKIMRKHKEIEIEDLQSLPFAISKGEYYYDFNRGNCLTVFYTKPDDQKLYLIGLKICDSGHEVWIQTYHRTKPRSANSKKTRAALLYSPKK